MLDPGSRRRQISTTLTTAYGEGLLSQRTLMHRMDLLLGSALVEPERLVGDLSARVPRRVAPDTLRRVLRAVSRTLGTRGAAAPTPLLALDWSGQTAELLVGRNPDCDVVLEHPTVSRRHAQLHHRDGTWIVHDLDSKNGTSVNRTPVVRCRLAPGDRVTIGAQALIVD